MNRRLSALLIVAGMGLAAIALLGLVLGDGEAEERGSGPLSWAREPRVTTPERLPEDRILSGRVRNDSLRRLRIPAGEVRLVAEGGEVVESSAVFVSSYLHGLYPPTRQPEELPDSELRRTGRLALIEPGESAPVTVAWHVVEGSRPLRLDYGSGSLPVP